jgi:hypothetical protein
MNLKNKLKRFEKNIKKEKYNRKDFEQRIPDLVIPMPPVVKPKVTALEFFIIGLLIWVALLTIILYEVAIVK